MAEQRSNKESRTDFDPLGKNQEGAVIDPLADDVNALVQENGDSIKEFLNNPITKVLLKYVMSVEYAATESLVSDPRLCEHEEVANVLRGRIHALRDIRGYVSLIEETYENSK